MADKVFSVEGLEKHFTNVQVVEGPPGVKYSYSVTDVRARFLGEFSFVIGGIAIFVDNFPGPKRYYNTELPIRSHYDLMSDLARVGLKLIPTEMVKIDILASELYEDYCEAVGGKAFNGDRLPSWVEFSADENKTKQVNAWRAVARAALKRF